MIVLFVLLGGYAFFLQSKLTLEVSPSPSRSAGMLCADTICPVGALSLQVPEQEPGTRGFVRSRGFKGEGSDNVSAQVITISHTCCIPSCRKTPERTYGYIYCQQQHRELLHVIRALVVSASMSASEAAVLLQTDRVKLLALATEEEMALMKKTQQLAEEVGSNTCVLTWQIS